MSHCTWALSSISDICMNVSTMFKPSSPTSTRSVSEGTSIRVIILSSYLFSVKKCTDTLYRKTITSYEKLNFFIQYLWTIRFMISFTPLGLCINTHWIISEWGEQYGFILERSRKTSIWANLEREEKPVQQGTWNSGPGNWGRGHRLEVKIDMEVKKDPMEVEKGLKEVIREAGILPRKKLQI